MKPNRLVQWVLLAGIVLAGLTGCRETAPVSQATPTPSLPITAAIPTSTLLPPTPVPTPVEESAHPWWNDTVFYEIFVRSFADSNGDGIGDLNGITARLDYLNDGDPATTTDLGVGGIWLMPIFPSPSYHGYDVTDYRAVNPDYGTLDDLKRLLLEAHKRGIRVILDFPINHTSSQHPWFKAAQDPASPYRDWYIWSQTDPGYLGPWNEQVWHLGATGYYYGVFATDMPDLNYRNPAVTKEIDSIAEFWLKEVGVDGFRVDGARHLVEDGKTQVNTPETHAWIKEFRSFYKAINREAFTVGEVWDSVFAETTYTQGDQFDLVFDFDMATGIMNGINRQSGKKVSGSISYDDALFKSSAYAPFLTNHDMERTMSFLGEDIEKAKSAAVALLTAPGVPFIYYGEEIGMTGNKPDPRLRTPMQWSAETGAGFTTGTPWEPLNTDLAQRNVALEEQDPQSLLTLYRALIHLRGEHPSLRLGSYTPLDSGADPVYAALRVSKTEATLTLMNLSGEPVSDYALEAASTPLQGRFKLTPLLGSGEAADLQTQADGAIHTYKSLVTLAPYSRFIFLLEPVS